MTPPPQASGAFVLVIDRHVYRQVPARDIDAVREAMTAGVDTVTFTSVGQVIQAPITGVEVGWAPERHPTPDPAPERGPAPTACPSCASRAALTASGEPS